MGGKLRRNSKLQRRRLEGLESQEEVAEKAIWQDERKNDRIWVSLVLLKWVSKFGYYEDLRWG